jgi:L-alanine-DL-glutamate epimerase-like enolase superfamily enzyme
MTLSLSHTHRSLALAAPFGIARGESESAEVVFVRVADGQDAGLGAVAPAAYYGESVESVTGVLPDLASVVGEYADPHAQQAIAHDLRTAAPAAAGARSAIMGALADLAACRLEVPLYRQWGLDPAAAPRSSYTIGIAPPATMAERAAAAVDRGVAHLKVKLGTDDDQARLRAVAEAAPEASLRVDANGAWDAETAVANTDWLADAGVTLLEQPVPADDLAGLRRVHDAGAVPVAADEACVSATDVPRVADVVDAVVVKLAKCGGPAAVRDQIAAAHAHDLDVMLGCMVSSRAAIAPAAHLAPLVEAVDLDGGLLLADGIDPVSGQVVQSDGRLDLASVEAGHGIRWTGDEFD